MGNGNTDKQSIDIKNRIEDVCKRIKEYEFILSKMKRERDEYYKLLKELDNNSEIGY